MSNDITGDFPSGQGNTFWLEGLISVLDSLQANILIPHRGREEKVERMPFELCAPSLFPCTNLHYSEQTKRGPKLTHPSSPTNKSGLDLPTTYRLCVLEYNHSRADQYQRT